MSELETRRVNTDRGDALAYSEEGRGAPTLLLLDGACGHRRFGPMESVREALASHHRVIHLDRRGRGESPREAPEDLERELRDVEALLDEVGEVVVMGVSSGAALALRVAARSDKVRGVIAFEPPFCLDGTRAQSPADFRSQIKEMLERGQRDEAAALFLRVVGVPRFGVWMMRRIPKVWRPLREGAHTLPADFAALGETQHGGPLPQEWEEVLGRIAAPALVLVGSKSPAYMHHAAKVVADRVAGAILEVVPGADHTAGGKLLGPPVAAFLSAQGRGEAGAA